MEQLKGLFQIDLLDLLRSTLQGISIGFLLLVFSLFLVPEQALIWILFKLKPNAIRKIVERKSGALIHVVNHLLGGNLHPHQGKNADNLARIRELNTDLKKIESNLFTLDMLTELFRLMTFLLRGHSASELGHVYKEFQNYFRNYSARLQDTSYRSGFGEDILHQFNKFAERLEEFENSGRSLDHDKVRSAVTELYTNTMGSLLDSEKQDLQKTHQLVRESIIMNIYQILEK